jgi:hypothetical protein
LRWLAVAAAVALAAALSLPGPEKRIIELPPGIVEVARPIVIGSWSEVRGHQGGSVVRMSDRFIGRALFEVRYAREVTFYDFAIDGNRAAHEQRRGLPPYNVPFSRFIQANGILAEDVQALRIENVLFREIAGFAVLAARAIDVSIERVLVENSGSRAPNGHNNATGGILLEGGSREFRVLQCAFRNVRGNAVWTHARATDARNQEGTIARNTFETIGRDAIQVGHATGVIVANNTGSGIGYPAETVDAIPVAIDTAGNVGRSVYADNWFEQINGKCIDLDGFHHGEVRGNTCLGVNGGYAIVMNNSNPEMRPEGVVIADNHVEDARWGAVFVIGSGNRVERNRLLNLNRARCGCVYSAEDPRLLNSGIYLGRGAERPARAQGNIIQKNRITGFGMSRNCVATAPEITGRENQVESNVCAER